MRDLVKINYDKNNPQAVVWIVKEEYDKQKKYFEEMEREFFRRCWFGLKDEKETTLKTGLYALGQVEDSPYKRRWIKPIINVEDFYGKY